MMKPSQLLQQLQQEEIGVAIVPSSSAGFSTAYKPLHIENTCALSPLHPLRFAFPFGAAPSKSHRIYRTVAYGKESAAVVGCEFIPAGVAITSRAAALPLKRRKGEGKRAAEAAATARAAIAAGGEADNSNVAEAAAAHRSTATTGRAARMCLMAVGTRVHILDVQQNEVVAHYSAIKNYARCVTARSDGKLFAVSDDSGLVQVIQTETRDMLRRCKGHSGPVRSCRFSVLDKSKLVSAGDDTQLRWWELSTGNCTAVLKGHADSIRSLDVYRGGSSAGLASEKDNNSMTSSLFNDYICLSGSYDCTARLWDARAPEASIILAHNKPVEYVRFVDCIPDSHMALTCSGAQVQIWDVRHCARSICISCAHAKTVTAAQVLSGKVVAAAAAHACRSAGVCKQKQSEGLERRSNNNVENGVAEDVQSVKESSESSGEDGDEEEEDDDNVGGNAELWQRLVLASASLDGTVKLSSLDTLQVWHTLDFGSDVMTLDFALVSTQSSLEKKTRFSAAFFVGTADGSWAVKQISRASDTSRQRASFLEESTIDKRAADRARKKRRLLLKMRASQAHYFSRGSGALPLEADIVVDGLQGKKGGRLNRLLRSFQYQAALDASLTSSPQHVVAVVVELLQRGGLEIAMRGRDAASILPLLEFVSKNITTRGSFSTHVICEMLMILLQECEEWIVFQGVEKRLFEMFKRIAQKIAFELHQIDHMEKLHSLLDSILAV